MAKQRFGLGRGLDALIPGTASDTEAQQPTRLDENSIVQVPLNAIIPNPRQPRKIFRDDDPRLLELSHSIKEHGLLQPIVVKRLDSSEEYGQENDPGWFSNEPSSNQQVREGAQPGTARYQIIAGERRWRASHLAKLSKVPVVIKEVTPQQMLELALIENIQRADLNPIEEAMAYQALADEYHLTHDQISERVGKDRSTVTNATRLLQLAPKVREALVNQVDNFTEGHARALIGIERLEDQVTMMGKIVTLGLTVRQAEEEARRIKEAERIQKGLEPRKTSARPRLSADLQDLEAQFRDSLMVKVDLKTTPKGKGTLVLHFNNQEELERLYGQLVKKGLDKA